MEHQPIPVVEKMTAQIMRSESRSSPRRSPFEVRMDILRVTTEGCAKPTQIMYRSNTSWIVLKKNLQSLIECGFMQESSDNSRTTYAVTDTGMAVVRDYLNLIHLGA
jgi:predicted transcriptional regulator